MWLLDDDIGSKRLLKLLSSIGITARVTSDLGVHGLVDGKLLKNIILVHGIDVFLTRDRNFVYQSGFDTEVFNSIARFAVMLTTVHAEKGKFDTFNKEIIKGAELLLKEDNVREGDFLGLPGKIEDELRNPSRAKINLLSNAIPNLIKIKPDDSIKALMEVEKLRRAGKFDLNQLNKKDILLPNGKSRFSVTCNNCSTRWIEERKRIQDVPTKHLCEVGTESDLVIHNVTWTKAAELTECGHACLNAAGNHCNCECLGFAHGSASINRPKKINQKS